jgi:AcrR family transcriptional regulator
MTPPAAQADKGPAPERTDQRIQRCALALFQEQGFDATTVTQIAAAAGVSSMTFFRYFATKEDVLLADPYDPLIARAVAAQPADLPPLERVCRGLTSALAQMDDLEDDTVRVRVRLAARHPGLRARMWQNNQTTEDMVALVLQGGGLSATAARVLAGASLGAVMAALLDWGLDEAGDSLAERIRYALDLLTPGACDDPRDDT